MALYLVQHGKNLPKEKDPDRGLSGEGIAEARRIAQVAAQYDVRVSRILHSGKPRAAQTADIFSRALKPSDGVAAVDGINPMDAVAPFVANIDVAENVMIVGHLPFLEKLLSFLITGKTEPPVFRMQNAGIVCLDRYPETTQLVICWALMPHVG